MSRRSRPVGAEATAPDLEDLSYLREFDPDAASLDDLVRELGVIGTQLHADRLAFLYDLRARIYEALATRFHVKSPVTAEWAKTDPAAVRDALRKHRSRASGRST